MVKVFFSHSTKDKELVFNLLEEFIRRKYGINTHCINQNLSGLRELNEFRSKGAIAHRSHTDYIQILNKYSLSNLSNIEISKKIISDLIFSLSNLIDLFNK